MGHKHILITPHKMAKIVRMAVKATIYIVFVAGHKHLKNALKHRKSLLISIPVN
jgi:hypothetical protein